ncbi:MAG: alpha/beta fold hydrolase [Anaerolineae bacterium]|nr:alpha/beta fold hydrolase [Anaerolineae bacterium]
MANHRVWIVGLALVLLIGGALPAAAQRPDAPQYAQPGPYGVGALEITIPGEEGTAGREAPLNATVWYPADPDAEGEVAGYRVGLFMLEGRALQDAPPDASGGPYPLVIFSHGSGGMRFQSLYLTEHLASHGFVVIAADHPGNTVQDVLFGGGDAAYLEGLIHNFGTRPLDILRQIAYLDALPADSPLAGLVDMDRIAVSGHSFGGYTALAAGGARLDTAAFRDWCAEPVLPEAPVAVRLAELSPDSVRDNVCFLTRSLPTIAERRGLESVPEGLWPATTDPRIRAAVMLSPYNVPIFGPEGLAAMTAPALIMVGSADSVTLPARDALAAFRHLGSAEKTLAVFENGDHYLFADGCSTAAIRLGQFERCSDAVWDMERAHDITNHLVTAFLRAQLYADEDAAAAFAAADFTGVIITR